MDSRKPKPQPRDWFELFQAHFDPLLNPGHELILPADKIDDRASEHRFFRLLLPGYRGTREGHSSDDGLA